MTKGRDISSRNVSSEQILASVLLLRFASVYKPERREALAKAGYEIFGNIGDQFSDLDGLFGAPHSFKLPNPSYLIL